MVVLKIIKKGEIRYVSHIDTMRVILRTLTRAGVNVKYSEGFNPHPLVNVSHPLTLGVESECEYACINNINGDSESILESFNLNAPLGMRAVKAYEVERNPNVAGKVSRAEYLFRGDFCKVLDRINAINDMGSLVVTYLKKGEWVSEDIKPMIFSIVATDNEIRAVLATGAPTLRPDRLLPYINEENPSKIAAKDITRTVQYVVEDGEMIEMDKYIERFVRV